MNQTRGFWLLSHALTSAMSISVKLQVQSSWQEFAIPLLEVGDCDFELELMYNHIAKVGVAILKPFLAFASKFNKEKAHNMLAIMLDPQYKGLQSISKFVGSTHVAKVLVSQYDKEILLPLLVKVYHHLNNATSAKSSTTSNLSHEEIDEFCVFGGGASSEKLLKVCC